MPHEPDVARPRCRDGAKSVGLGILGVLVVVGRIWAVRWTGPLNTPDLLFTHCAVAGLSLLGARFGASGRRTERNKTLATLGLAFNLLIVAGLSVVVFLVLSAGP